MKLRADLVLLAALALAGCGSTRADDGWGYASDRYAPAPGGYAPGGYAAGGYAQAEPQYPAPAEPDAPGAGYGPPGAQPYPQYAPPAQDAAAGYPPAAMTPPPGVPSGSSQRAPDDGRYDEVGYAEVRGLASADPAAAGQVVAVHPTLPSGSFVEVTALDSGRTVLVLITGPLAPSSALIALSPAAAQQLGIRSTTPVRIRKVHPPAQDQAALRSGRAAPLRIDAPEALLVGLRRQLAAAPPPAAAPAPAGPTPGTGYAPPAATRSPGTGAGYYVQVAALSNGSRAQTLARSLGGFVRQANGLYRVQMGPYATSAEAERARATAAGRGFGDARIFTAN